MAGRIIYSRCVFGRSLASGVVPRCRLHAARSWHRDVSGQAASPVPQFEPPPKRHYFRRTGSFIWRYKGTIVVVGILVSAYATYRKLGAMQSIFLEKLYKVEDDMTLVIDLSKIIVAQSPGVPSTQDFVLNQKSTRIISLPHLLQAIYLAAADPQITSLQIILDGKNYGEGHLAMMQEIRTAVAAFKKAKKERSVPVSKPEGLDQDRSNKPIVTAVSIGTMSQVEYYLSGIADKVYLHPCGLLRFEGLSYGTLFFKQMLDNLGVFVHVEARERHKSAMAALESTAWNEETKENIEAIVNDWITQYNTVLTNRGLEFKEVADDGPYTAEMALKKMLVDGLVFLEDLDDKKSITISRYRTAKFLRSIGAMKKMGRLFGGGTVTQVELPSEEISKTNDTQLAFAAQTALKLLTESEGENATAMLQGNVGLIYLTDTIGSQARRVAQELRKAADNVLVDCIILRVNSPGGDPAASATIHHAIEYAKKKKPTVASYGDVSASGGYYASCNADRIFASPGTITGSIGVIAMRLDVRNLLAKMGASVDAVKFGQNIDLMSPLTEMSPTHRKKFAELVDSIYQNFKERVAEGRAMSMEQVETLAGGRIFTGHQALQNGLVDQMGGIMEAAEWTVLQKLDSAVKNYMMSVASHASSLPEVGTQIARSAELNNKEYSLHVAANLIDLYPKSDPTSNLLRSVVQDYIEMQEEGLMESSVIGGLAVCFENLLGMLAQSGWDTSRMKGFIFSSVQELLRESTMIQLSMSSTDLPNSIACM